MSTHRWAGPLLLYITLLMPSPESAANDLYRLIDNGPVMGVRTSNAVDAWLGIPYARPPMGPLRWRAPQPVAPWQELRHTDAFAEACSQPAMLGTPTSAPLGSEDCLYLNVWSPRGANELPVMVWIHGGANRFGSGRIDPQRLVAEQQVVVVSFNYRLGIFGWFRHPQLHSDDASDDDRSGNFATLDQMAALAWVQRNIAHFGGNPRNVTIFGESAGGTNVLALLTTQAAGTLFQKAIAQSGIATRGLSVAAAENAVDATPAGDPLSAHEILLQRLIDNGEAANRAQAQKLYATLPTNDVSQRFYDSDFAQLSTAADTLQRRHYPEAGVVFHPQLIRDGHVLSLKSVAEALASPGKARDVAVILGSTREEARLFLLYNRHFAVPHPNSAFTVRVLNRDLFEVAAHYENRLWTWAGVDAPALALNQWRDHGVFAYRFDWDKAPPQAWMDNLRPGAMHGLDVPFVFGQLGPGDSPLLTSPFEHDAGVAELSAAIMSYWAEFAYRGDPGRGRDGTLPPWLPWRADTQENVLVLDTPITAIRMITSRVDRQTLLNELAQDSVAGSTLIERCRLLKQMVEGSAFSFEWQDYRAFAEGHCNSRFTAIAD